MKKKVFVCSGIFIVIVAIFSFIYSGYFVSSANELDESIPAELFDIRMDLEETTLENSNELRAVITYESFGRVPTYVDLDYSVYDESGGKVYTKFGEIIVEVEEMQRIDFPDLNLLDGEYEFVFTTLYNVDVFDEFRQFFTVKKKGFFARLLAFFGIGK
ncbi:hypothetical protein KAS08_02195 [Candidatus Pacearchaeota archaeon]|nr:hypothetical protein [Candidatus Pacearchaeota archaeon]